MKEYLLAFMLLLSAVVACGIALEGTLPEPQTESVSIPSTEEAVSEYVTEAQTEEVPPTQEEPMYYDCPLSHDLQDYIREQCERQGISMSLVIALIEVESSFQADVISQSDDYGLMQINVINHGWLYEEYGITDFLDPYNNILCGITILSQHYERYGDETKALMAYNMGATGAKRNWDRGIFETTYTRKIQSAKERYDLEIK